MVRRSAAGIQWLIFLVFLIGAIVTAWFLKHNSLGFVVLVPIIIIVVGWLVAASVHVANQWEKAVVLRLGKFRVLAGPGMFVIIPFLDTIPTYIDQRVISTQFTAEQTLTKDSIPVNVDAVLFWLVWDARRAALEVASYVDSIAWAAQTALRDVIGKTDLADLLSTRETIDLELKTLMDERTEPWGITIQNVQIRDIKIPGNLQDAMSRAAQADRERMARTILGDAERQVAQSFVEAAEMYNNNPVALQLRAMNILYEGIKENASLIIVPSALADSANIGNILGIANGQNLLGTINTGKKDG